MREDTHALGHKAEAGRHEAPPTVLAQKKRLKAAGIRSSSLRVSRMLKEGWKRLIHDWRNQSILYFTKTHINQAQRTVWLSREHKKKANSWRASLCPEGSP